MSKLSATSNLKTYQAINFGCRVNAAETNQLSQGLSNLGLTHSENNPDVFIVNTCAITKKGEYESIYKIKKLIADNPKIKIIATGCANLDKIKHLPNIQVISNHSKDLLSSSYSPQVKDKFSHTYRYLLKVQSGCTTNCTFCIVPSRRSSLFSLPIQTAVNTINSATTYKEVIITGVNLAQYQYGLSNLVEALLTKTKIDLISFGSVPLLCLDEKLINLYQKYPTRLSHFLHIPIQSGSNKILKLMHRPYNNFKIIKLIKNYKLKIKNLSLGTDIIVGFPTETDSDFQQTYDLCQQIDFNKIHVFKYSPRPGTQAREMFLKSIKISKEKLLERSHAISSCQLTIG